MPKKLTEKQIWKENEQDKIKLLKTQVECQFFANCLKDL